MKRTIFLLLLTLPLFQSCGGQEHHEGSALKVSLDNGNRWQANPETTQGIANMQAILAKYADQTKTQEDQKALRQALETEFQNIFKLCTMKGEAHNQLHNYLLPMKEIFKKIESGTATESQAAVGQLDNHLTMYQNYFQ